MLNFFEFIVEVFFDQQAWAACWAEVGWMFYLVAGIWAGYQVRRFIKRLIRRQRRRHRRHRS